MGPVVLERVVVLVQLVLAGDLLLPGVLRHAGVLPAGHVHDDDVVRIERGDDDHDVLRPLAAS